MNQFLKKSPFGNIGGIIVIAIIMIGLFFLVGQLFKLLYFLAPILLILTLVLNYRVVLDYGKYVLKTLKENPLFGIVIIVLSFLAYPILFTYLLAKAYLSRNAGDSDGEEGNGFADYEEIAEDPLDLEDLERSERNRDDDMEGYFKD